MSHVNQSFLEALRDATILAPQGPDAVAFETLERLQELEAQLVGAGKPWSEVSTADYTTGSATEDDDVETYGEEVARVVLSADHATSPYSRQKEEYRCADHGTGGLAMLLAECERAVSIVPKGRQTWNVAVSDDTHPVKKEILRLLPERPGFLSLHGMYAGKVRHLTDPTEVHAVIGLGADPNEESYEAARKIVAAGHDLGLNVSIANEEALYKCDPGVGELELDPDTHQPVTTRLRGSKPTMTNALAYRIECAIQERKQRMQLELTALLRLMPLDYESGWHRDRKSRAMGVHLGYLLTSAATEAAASGNTVQREHTK
jgi:hypothetical protein